MKRLLLGVLLCAALLIFGAAALAEANTTLLVYMVGTDIETSACVDLLEMADAKNDEEINIVVLAGGTKKWRLQELKGGVRNLAVIRNGRIDTVTSWGRKSMGSAQSLSEFLTYGLKEYPAQRTMLVLWDHGAGSEGGVCFDEIFLLQFAFALFEGEVVLKFEQFFFFFLYGAFDVRVRADFVEFEPAAEALDLLLF